MIGAIISTAAGVAGSLIGGYHASKAMKKVRRMIDRKDQENQTWYDRRMNQDYTQTAQAQDAIRRTREYADELIRRAEGVNVVNGGTQEALMEARRQASKAVGDTMADIASSADQTKKNVEMQYRRNRSNIMQQRQAILKQKAESISRAASF